MIPGALAMRKSYGDLRLPVTIIAGASDRVVFKERSEQFVEGAGHIIHYFEPVRIVAAVNRIVGLFEGSLRLRSPRSQSLGKVDEVIDQSSKEFVISFTEGSCPLDYDLQSF